MARGRAHLMHTHRRREKAEQGLLPIIVHRFSEVTIRMPVVNAAGDRSVAHAPLG